MINERTVVQIELSPEHIAMLDGICAEAGGMHRRTMAKNLLIAVLEEDAAAHGAFGNPDDKVIILRDHFRKKPGAT